MESNGDIKLTFKLKSGITHEMLIRVTDNSVIQIDKRIYPKSVYPDGYCEYYLGSSFLDSFDDSHHKDYSLEELIETIDEDGCHNYKTCFWND